MKISENTSVQLDLKTVIAIITITASFVGMYYTLQADIEEAKKLPPTEVKRLEYDLKQQWQTEHIEDLEERVNMLEQVDDVVFEEINIMSALMKDGTDNDGKLEELNKQLPGIPIGTIGDGEFNIQEITVGIYKSIYNNLTALSNQFSMVMVDEAHLCPAELFSNALNNINCKIKIAVTATPKRKDGKHIVLDDYFTAFKVYAQDLSKKDSPLVELVKTDIPFQVLDPKRDWSRQLNKLTERNEYINLISEIATQDIANGRCPLILSDRVNMLKNLQKLIKGSVLLIGETKEENRKDILNNTGNKYKAILSTKIFDEGISCHRLDTLYLTCPSNNPIKLEQRIGRILREHPDKKHPLIRDFQLRGAIVHKQQLNRLNWYQEKGFIL